MVLVSGYMECVKLQATTVCHAIPLIYCSVVLLTFTSSIVHYAINHTCVHIHYIYVNISIANSVYMHRHIIAV